MEIEDVKMQLEKERQKLLYEINEKIAKKKKLIIEDPENEYQK